MASQEKDALIVVVQGDPDTARTKALKLVLDSLEGRDEDGFKVRGFWKKLASDDAETGNPVDSFTAYVENVIGRPDFWKDQTRRSFAGARTIEGNLTRLKKLLQADDMNASEIKSLILKLGNQTTRLAQKTDVERTAALNAKAIRRILTNVLFKDVTLREASFNKNVLVSPPSPVSLEDISTLERLSADSWSIQASRKAAFPHVDDLSIAQSIVDTFNSKQIDVDILLTEMIDREDGIELCLAGALAIGRSGNLEDALRLCRVLHSLVLNKNRDELVGMIMLTQALLFRRHGDSMGCDIYAIEAASAFADFGLSSQAAAALELCGPTHG